MSIIKGKALWLFAFALAAMMFAVVSTDRANAGIQVVNGAPGVWSIDSFFGVDDDCDSEGDLLAGLADDDLELDTDDVLVLPVGGSIWICVELDEEGDPGGDADYDRVDFDSNDYGTWESALCADEDGDDNFEADDFCEDTTGLGTDNMSILCNTPDLDSECQADGADGDVAALFECEDDGGITTITISHDIDQFPGIGAGKDLVQFTIFCQADPDELEISVSEDSVEIIPAIGNVAHSELTIVVSGDGLSVDPDTEIDITVSDCAIEVGADDPDGSPLTDNTPSDSGADIDVDLDDDTTWSNIWFHADVDDCSPGDVTLTVTVERPGPDLVESLTINVVGPVAFIDAEASPTELICGEKAQILVTATDAIGQPVSDNTQLELITNYGGVLGGSGSTLSFPGIGPVNPLSSGAVATYNGDGIAYLLTSINHVGDYEVVISGGGTLGLSFYNELYEHKADPFFDRDERRGRHHDHADFTRHLTQPIVTQVTVTCSLPEAPAPEVEAPDTGTGSITPPSTGDAGLAAGSSSNAMALVIAGAVAFVLAGAASIKFARR